MVPAHCTRPYVRPVAATMANRAVEPTLVVAGTNDHRRRARHINLASRPRIDLSRKFVGHARIDVQFLARVGVACAEELDHLGLSAESAAVQLPLGVGDQIGAAKGLRGQRQRGSRGNNQGKHGRSKGEPHRSKTDVDSIISSIYNGTNLLGSVCPFAECLSCHGTS